MQSLNNRISAESEYKFIPKCSFCKQEMVISEGDVVYDSKWYHETCWGCLEREQAPKLSHVDNDFASLA